MRKKRRKIHIGLRTIKTAAAVTIAMLLVNIYGASTSKLIFAMLGAMVAMEQTFRDSVKSCLTQIVGVLFGGVVGVLLLFLPIPTLMMAVIGIVIVILSYNLFQIRFSPSLPCLIMVIVCTTPDINPWFYALERIWDTAIGLVVGLLVNMLIFPYDNSRQIRETAESLDKELLMFLEDMFDGDDHLPDAEKMITIVDLMAKQLRIFSNQRFLLHRKRYRREFASLQLGEGKARELVAHMEVLCRMEPVGRLNEENRCRLKECGADIQEERRIDSLQELDIVTNYHVSQLIILRSQLLDALGI